MPAAQRAQPPALAHADLWFARDRETSPARVACHGWLLLAATTLGCGAMLYATLLAKLLPRTGHALLDAVREVRAARRVARVGARKK
jgi:hypothetical protein